MNMKLIKNIFKTVFIILVIISCDENRDLDFLDTIAPPTNVSATFDVTQDNTGVVTITPNADGANSYEVVFGDGSDNVTILAGESVEHTYAEGNYDVTIRAFNIKEDVTEATVPLVVSFMAPSNLVTTIENDAAISKQVNVTVTADYAVSYDFYSGEPGITDPVATANIGETVSYTYTNPGTYSLRIVVKGAAIQTTEYTEDFEVTEILQPIASAATPPTRNPQDVISIYGSEYDNVAGTDTFPDWGQAGQGSSWGTFTLNGDDMLQYTNLSYQGIQFGAPQDVSAMEYIHLDVWTSANADITRLETSLISVSNGEKPVWSDLTAGEWTSIDIPISDFTDQGLTVADIHQLKFVGDPWAAGTVFIDNIYFYKSPSSTVVSGIQDFEGTAPTFTVFGNIAATEVVANPDPTGANTTANVAKLTKTNGSEVWAGTFFEVASPLDFNTYSKISVKTWSPKNGVVVKVKLENADASVTYEQDLNTSVANAWEELVYDFSGAPAGDYVRVVIFFDFGNPGDDSLYYFDEYTLTN